MTVDPGIFYAGGLGVSTYDLLFQANPLNGDVDYYIDCAQRFGGPVLELGAGTGRITIPLAEAGFDVTGIDISPAMLSFATAKLEKIPDLANRVEFIEGDMTTFDLGKRFAVTIIPARSFQHVVTPEGQRAVLRNVHKHLLPGGHLILDLFDPRLDMIVAEGANDLPRHETRDPATGNLVRRTSLSRRDNPFRQVFEETMRIEVIDSSGTILASEETSWQLRWNLRQEMAYLLELTGFNVVAEFSDFNGSPPSYGREQLWIAQSGG